MKNNSCSYYPLIYSSLLHILLDPVPCETDDRYGDIQYTAHGLIVRANIVEEMEENLLGQLNLKKDFMPL